MKLQSPVPGHPGTPETRHRGVNPGPASRHRDRQDAETRTSDPNVSMDTGEV